MNPYQEYLDALNEFQTALLQFDEADLEHVDVATYRLQSAEEKVKVALRSMKGEGQIA